MAQEKYLIPMVTSEDQWYTLIGQREVAARNHIDDFGTHSKTSMVINPVRNDQLLVIDVFTEWSGPCLAVESHLRKLRHSFVDAPDTLALARACCDNIEYLKPFRHDIRPTFLFWARGGPVALLRGANRPLLTRLIAEEVEIEAKQQERLNIEIDFESDRVIQCQGELSNLESNEVVRSIGRGNTDCLTVVFNIIDTKSRSPGMQDETEEFRLGLEQIEAQSHSDFDRNGLFERDLEGDEDIEKDLQDYNCHEDEKFQGEDYGDQVDLHGEDEDDYEDGYPDDNSSDDEDMDDIQLMSDKVRLNNPNGEDLSGDDLINPFGKRRKKKKKKMEVGLLKEILEFKPVKRFGH